MKARTLMAVHAHPDDEVISTGGVLALYSDRDVRTVVVTCTDGSQGYGPRGVLPGENGHDLDGVARQRAEELERSCSLLGVTHLERLGYRDSGMKGWPGNKANGAFCNTVIEQVASRLSALFERYEPQVVVTYDANGAMGTLITYRPTGSPWRRSTRPVIPFRRCTSRPAARATWCA